MDMVLDWFLQISPYHLSLLMGVVGIAVDLWRYLGGQTSLKNPLAWINLIAAWGCVWFVVDSWIAVGGFAFGLIVRLAVLAREHNRLS